MQQAPGCRCPVSTKGEHAISLGAVQADCAYALTTVVAVHTTGKSGPDPAFLVPSLPGPRNIDILLKTIKHGY